MTTQLEEFKFGWKALNEALNRIAAAVNSNMPLPGEQISLDERGVLGVSINVSGQTHWATTNPQGTGGGGGAAAASTQTVSLIAFDTNFNLIKVNLLTDGNSPTPITTNWLVVNLMDPVTCIQTTQIFLTKPS